MKPDPHLLLAVSGHGYGHLAQCAPVINALWQRLPRLRLTVCSRLERGVIADRLAFFVNLVYDQPHNYQGLTLIVATLFFSIQIYADFSGYTDMAIGMAQVMGYNLADPDNPQPALDEDGNPLDQGHHPIFIGKTFKQMMKQDVKDEQVAIDLYKQIIQQAEKENDPTTKKLFETILAEEEDHLDMFRGLLGK